MTWVEALDAASAQLNRSRASVIRQALARYLEDFDDISVALERLQDPSDPSLTGMMSGVSYSVRIKRSAAKELAGVSQPLRTRVVNAIAGWPSNRWQGTR